MNYYGVNGIRNKLCKIVTNKDRLSTRWIPVRPSDSMQILMHRGFTLIECLVTLAIAGIILTSCIHFFLQHQSRIEQQTQAIESQENLRFALQALSRDLQQAGFWGCQSHRKEKPASHLNPAHPLTRALLNGLDVRQNHSTSESELHLVYADAKRAVPVSASAALGVYDVRAHPEDLSRSHLKPFDVVVLNNCVKATFMMITQMNRSQGIITFEPFKAATQPVAYQGLSNLARPVPPEYKESQSTLWLYPIERVHYHISKGIHGVGLFRNQHEIAHNIHRLSFRYAFDLNCDGHKDIQSSDFTYLWSSLHSLEFNLHYHASNPNRLTQKTSMWQRIRMPCAYAHS